LANLGEQVELFLCTQNVDHLHERAGSRDVAHMHGSLFQSRCPDGCSPPVDDNTIYTSLQDVPSCGYCGERMRPNITFFGEIPMHLPLIDQHLEDATVLLVVGTSGTVHPAARFVDEANKRGIHTVYVGLENPLNFYKFTEVHLGVASEMQFQIN
jgi:NAD-dependent deacetylase